MRVESGSIIPAFGQGQKIVDIRLKFTVYDIFSQHEGHSPVSPLVRRLVRVELCRSVGRAMNVSLGDRRELYLEPLRQ